MNTLSPILDPQGLQVLQGSDELVIFDASSGPNARANYEKKHLKGALFVDLDTQLSSIGDPTKGGRHPLPAAKDFGITLGKLGITPKSYVVVYDTMSGGNAAARLWWMLKAVGHDRVQVLNGGLAYAEAVGYPMEKGPKTPQSAKEAYPVSAWGLPTASIEEVATAVSTDHVVIDVRSQARYAGEVEPIDLIAGHIPGAINIPFEENLDDQGRFLPADQLKSKYADIFGKRSKEEVIVHCGSGVTACHTLLAMQYAGYGIPWLYVGSWSEWSRNDRPMVTKS